MAKLKIVLNRKGVRELLQSPEISRCCEQVAKSKAKAMGSQYEVESFIAQTRVVFRIYTDDPSAIDDNLKNNTMLKAISSSAAKGKTVQGYWRTSKSGKRIYVNSYQRKK